MEYYEAITIAEMQVQSLKQELELAKLTVHRYEGAVIGAESVLEKLKEENRREQQEASERADLECDLPIGT